MLCILSYFVGNMTGRAMYYWKGYVLLPKVYVNDQFKYIAPLGYCVQVCDSVILGCTGLEGDIFIVFWLSVS